jgi:hypothetical protein
MMVRSTKQLLCGIYDAEAIAFRIGEDYVVSVRGSFAPVHFGSAQRDQALDLSSLIVGIQVQVNAWRHSDRCWMLVEGKVGSDTIPRAQQHEVVAVFLARHIVKRSCPKCGLTLQIIHA